MPVATGEGASFAVWTAACIQPRDGQTDWQLKGTAVHYKTRHHSHKYMFFQPQGYAFCEYVDNTLTEYVIQSLNGKPVGSKFLTVKRALGPTGALTSPLPTVSTSSQPLPTSPLLVPRP